jgi:20S proteasome alpha/beta subunit
MILREDCLKRRLSSEDCHPELGVLCRAKDLDVLRDEPARRKKRAFSTLPNSSLYVVKLLSDPPATTHYFYDSCLNRVNPPNLQKYIQDYLLHKSRARMIKAKPLPFIAPRKPFVAHKLRLPERKRMTFIVGLRCTDGLVLCSDSLEADGYNKRMVKKLFKYEGDGWGLAFGCSSSSAACTNFGDRLLELLDDKQPYDRRGTEKLIEATMAYMKREYPEEILAVVIALWSCKPTKELRLYKAHSHTQCLQVESDYTCAGLDVSLARFLLDSVVGGEDIRVLEGAFIANFITSVMKEKADGVGGPIQMILYRNSETRWEDAPRILMHKIETLFFSFPDLEKSVRQHCWSRFPHQFRPEK